MEVSEDRRIQDQIEIQYFAYCSTQIYVNYRKFIDKNIQIVVVDLANWLQENTSPNSCNNINKMLFERYQLFWKELTPKMEAFYEDVQKILKESVETLKAGHKNEREMCPQDIITLDETSAAEIDDLQAEYITEKHYLNELKKKLDSLKGYKEQHEKLHLVINNHKKKEEFKEITQVETKIDKVMSEVGTKPVIKKVCATIIRSKCSQGLCKNDIMKKLTALKKTK